MIKNKMPDAFPALGILFEEDAKNFLQITP